MQKMIFAADAGVYYAFVNSDAVGKSIVVLLLIFSIFTWTIMIERFMVVYRARKLSENFLSKFTANSRNLTYPALMREAVSDPAPVARIYCKGVEKMSEFYAENQADFNAVGETPALKKLTEEQISAIEAVLEREVSNQIFYLESKIGLLATMVSVSPFFGLFGTVWGVMMAFVGIAAAGRSDFQALAPGIAGALLTTVAGLIVAIPSLMGYNLLTSNIRKVTVTMDNFSEEFIVKLKLDQLKQKHPGHHSE